MSRETERRKVTNEYLRVLREGTEKPIGDMKAPTKSDGTAEDYPFGILQPIPGGGFSGPPWGLHPDGDIDFVYQVTSVGSTREQAEAMADLVRDVTLGRDDSGGFKHVMVGVAEREPDGGPAGTDLEGESPYELFSVPDRYVLRTLHD